MTGGFFYPMLKHGATILICFAEKNSSSNQKAIMKYSKSLFPSLIIWLIIVILSLLFIFFTKFGIYHNGIILGLAAGLIDIFISTHFLLKSLKSKINTGIQLFMTAGLFFRMFAIVSLSLLFNSVEADAGYAFAITYLITHFGHIAGIFWVVNKHIILSKAQKSQEKPESIEIP